MTNFGFIPPQPGFHDALRQLTRETGTVLIIDETHTLSSGPGGYTREHGLTPDMFVVGMAWHAMRVGARVELILSEQKPRDATQYRRTRDPEIDALLHLHLMNRGVLITPFHNMTLCCPATTAADIDAFDSGFQRFLSDLQG